MKRKYRNSYNLYDGEENVGARESAEGNDRIHSSPSSEEKEFSALLKTLKRLRGKDGCPWDRAQTIKSMTPYIIEEAYEVVDAAGAGGVEKLKIEIGDLLFLLLFVANVAEEAGMFGLEDVLAACNSKMMRRHPHVFGGPRAAEPLEASKNWEHVKQTAEERTFGERPLETLPALIAAYRIQEKAAAFGFDWENTGGIVEKIKEEVGELSGSLGKGEGARDEVEEELGDLLFSVVNLARFMKIDPERLLRMTINKFSKRLRYIDRKLGEQGKRLEEATLAEMEELWQQAKGEDSDA